MASLSPSELFRVAQAQLQNRRAANPFASLVDSISGGLGAGIAQGIQQRLAIDELRKKKQIEGEIEAEQLRLKEKIAEDTRQKRTDEVIALVKSSNSDHSKTVLVSEDKETAGKKGLEASRGMITGQQTRLVPSGTIRGGADLKVEKESRQDAFARNLSSLQQSGDINNPSVVTALRAEYPEFNKDIDSFLINNRTPATSSGRGVPLNVTQPELSTPTVNDQQGSPTIDQGEFQIKELDALQRPTGFERVKPSAAQEKRDVENKELAIGSGIMFDFLNRGIAKAKERIPGYGSGGIKGRFANQLAIIDGKFGNNPDLNEYLNQSKAFATITAKAAGEVRPTDRDIERFFGAMLNPSKSFAENAIAAERILRELEAKGVNVDWANKAVGDFEAITGVDVLGFGDTFEANDKTVGKYKILGVRDQ